MAEYISKQKVKDLMGCCLASAKANFKAETNVIRKVQFHDQVDTIEAMINVVDSVEVPDVQEKRYCKMIPFEPDCRNYTDVFICTNCHQHIHLGFISKEYSGSYCIECGAEVQDSDTK